MPPSIRILSPVAVMMMSASSSLPDLSGSPVSVKVSISSVSIEALPSRNACNKSALISTHPLVPGHIPGREVTHVDGRADLPAHAGEQHRRMSCGQRLQPIAGALEHDVAPVRE